MVCNISTITKLGGSIWTPVRPHVISKSGLYIRHTMSVIPFRGHNLLHCLPTSVLGASWMPILSLCFYSLVVSLEQWLTKFSVHQSPGGRPVRWLKGKGACSQAGQPEFSPWNRYDVMQVVLWPSHTYTHLTSLSLYLQLPNKDTETYYELWKLGLI